MSASTSLEHTTFAMDSPHDCIGVAQNASHLRDRARLAPSSALFTNSMGQRSCVNRLPCHGGIIERLGYIQSCGKRHLSRLLCPLFSPGTVAAWLNFAIIRAILLALCMVLQLLRYINCKWQSGASYCTARHSLVTQAEPICPCRSALMQELGEES